MIDEWTDRKRMREGRREKENRMERGSVRETRSEWESRRERDGE